MTIFILRCENHLHNFYTNYNCSLVVLPQFCHKNVVKLVYLVTKKTVQMKRKLEMKNETYAVRKQRKITIFTIFTR